MKKEAGKNLLIVYREGGIHINGEKHEDPTFKPEWSYCNDKREGLRKCNRGNHVFFHTTKVDTKSGEKQRYIKAYFVVKDMGLGEQIVPKYKIKGDASHAKHIPNHYVIVGDEKLSKELKGLGLKFDRALAEKLTFDPPKKIKFGITNKDGRRLSDLECISSATRKIRALSDDDVKVLFGEIDRQGLR